MEPLPMSSDISGAQVDISGRSISLFFPRLPGFTGFSGFPPLSAFQPLSPLEPIIFPIGPVLNIPSNTIITDDTSSVENTNKRRILDNPTSIDQSSINYSRRFKKSKKIKKEKKKKEESVFDKKITELEKLILRQKKRDIYLSYCKDLNPYDTDTLIYYKLKREELICFKYKTDPSHIRILIPNIHKDVHYRSIFFRLSYMVGSIFDWVIFFHEYNTPCFIFNNKNKNKKYNISNKIKIARSIYEENQKIRWSFKRLVSIWLIRKCKNRIIGADSDLVTMEPVNSFDKIQLICITTRSMYIFSGQALIRSIVSNLESQQAAIPNVTEPKNPYTNIEFKYGQMTYIYKQLLLWCYTRSKPMPSLISLYMKPN
jgi:hypothetical protein